ncbi:MAG: hypothetical protein ACTHML_06150 [Ginsengibacter sp.]|jgi:hypothetical protein
MKFAKYVFWILIVSLAVSSCAKEYSSEKLRPVLGGWQFTKGGINYSGYLNNVYSTSGVGSNVMYILGTSANGAQQFQIKLLGSSFPPGNYYASEFQSVFSYSLPSKTIYYANESTGEFVVNLIASDSTNIQGTFSGLVYDSTSNPVEITNGKFSTY